MKKLFLIVLVLASAQAMADVICKDANSPHAVVAQLSTEKHGNSVIAGDKVRTRYVSGIIKGWHWDGEGFTGNSENPNKYQYTIKVNPNGAGAFYDYTNAIEVKPSLMLTCE